MYPITLYSKCFQHLLYKQGERRGGIEKTSALAKSVCLKAQLNSSSHNLTQMSGEMRTGRSCSPKSPHAKKYCRPRSFCSRYGGAEGCLSQTAPGDLPLKLDQFHTSLRSCPLFFKILLLTCLTALHPNPSLSVITHRLITAPPHPSIIRCYETEFPISLDHPLLNQADQTTSWPVERSSPVTSFGTEALQWLTPPHTHPPLQAIKCSRWT